MRERRSNSVSLSFALLADAVHPLPAISPPAVRHESSLHRAQRNALCTGTICLLIFVIHRLHALLKEVNQLSATREALAKQAEGAAAAYKAACEERDAARGGAERKESEKKEAADAARERSEAEDELESAKQTIATLRERNSTLLGEKEKAAKDVEALTKQAKGLSDEYARLLMQKESLENKLADYELVFGDDVKKAK